MTTHPQMTALAITFFSRFSRFEYALKQFPEFREGSEKRVDPNWDKFSHAKEIAPLFDQLRGDAVSAYLIEEPPMKRIVRDGRLDWKQEDRPSNMTQLLLALRLVRNNLFHGDKMNPNLTRNIQLFEASIAILDAMLAAHEGVRNAYEFNQEIG